MKDMKSGQSNGILKDHLGLTFVVLVVVILLIGSLAPFSMTATADEDDGEEETGVPRWNEGDRWKYSDKVPIPMQSGTGMGTIEDDYVETIMEMEVTDDNFQVNAHGPNGEKEPYESYQVRETHNVDDPENQSKIDIYYSKDNLAQVYNDPEGSVSSAYHPPIVELDFPLRVGKNWSTDPGYDNHYDLARYFEDPGDPDEGEYSEPERKYAFLGQVENKTTKKVNLEKGSKEFETYKVNSTVLSYDEEENKSQLNRYEMYYSPEVKNLVHTDIFEVRRVPEDRKIGDIGGIKESQVGNQTLLSFDVDPYEPNEDEETSLLGVGIVLLIIGVGTASFYVYKKVKSSF